MCSKMFKVLFATTLFVTLVVNIIFLFATKDKPPDLNTSTFISAEIEADSQRPSHRRLFLRSNDFYDYANIATASSSLTDSTVANEGSVKSSQNPNKSIVAKYQIPNEEGKKSVSKVIPSTEVRKFISVNERPYESANPNRNFISSDESQESTRSYGVDEVQNELEHGEFSSQITRPNTSEITNGNSQDDAMTRIAPMGQMKSYIDPSRGLQSVGDLPVQPGGKVDNLRSLNIKVKSSKDHVYVIVDDNIIYESKSKLDSRSFSVRSQFNSRKRKVDRAPTTVQSMVEEEMSNSDGRGIHVLVLNQFDGYVMSKRIFDTYSPNQDEELCFYLNMIREGRIMIFAIKDEASFKMASDSPARKLLHKMGSNQIINLKWRDMWAFIVRKEIVHESNLKIGDAKSRLRSEFSSRVNIAESISKSPSFSDWGQPVVLEARVDLVDRNFIRDGQLSYDCVWNSGNGDTDRRRWDFCSRIEGYGRVCDCDSPARINFEPKKMKSSKLTQVPIVVIASNRPFYLYRMLHSLLNVEGIDPSMIIIFIDGFYEEPLMVCRLLNLRVIQQKPYGLKSARISHHYKSSLTATFELFPKSEFAIIFEEDLDIASDTLIYFNQTLDLLKNDQSLYCVSAWNDQGYEHTSKDNNLIYRVETMPGLGWMLSRKLYKEELEPQWPSAEQSHDWDMWIRTQPIRKGRECLIPDISRTFHFGSRGTNINSYFQKQYFSKHAFNLKPVHEFSHLDQLSRDNYENVIHDILIRSNPIRFEKNETEASISRRLCALADVDIDNLSSSLSSGKESTIDNDNAHDVIYIRMSHDHDFKNWLLLAKCWRIWDLDSRGQHNSMWRLFLNGRSTLVVGVPASPYSRFKPNNFKPYDIIV